MRNDFAVLILTHGRANNVLTYHTLRKQGYTGKIYLVIDNEDDQEELYYTNFGSENVIKFDKMAWAEKTDTMDITGDRRAVVFARNACWTIAKEIGLKYFLVLDDDYNCFMYRQEVDKKLIGINVKSFDDLCDIFLDFLDESGALTVCMAQGGDYIGGVESGFWEKKITRKAMNVWFCRTDRPFEFYGRINEDTTAYAINGMRGNLMFTVAAVCVLQLTTQANAGGLTDIYLNLGTYVKSFYSVMMCPSCVKVGVMGVSDLRIHHSVSWDNCTPQILSDRHKK